MISSSVKSEDVLFAKTDFRKDAHKEFEMKKELTTMKEALQKLEAKINGHYSTQLYDSQNCPNYLSSFIIKCIILATEEMIFFANYFLYTVFG